MFNPPEPKRSSTYGIPPGWVSVQAPSPTPTQQLSVTSHRPVSPCNPFARFGFPLHRRTFVHHSLFGRRLVGIRHLILHCHHVSTYTLPLRSNSILVLRSLSPSFLMSSKRPKFGLRALTSKLSEFNHKQPTPPRPKHAHHSTSRNRVIPPEEDMRRLFQECKFAKGNAALLSEALTFAKPEDLQSKEIIKVRFRSFVRACLPAPPRSSSSDCRCTYRSFTQNVDTRMSSSPRRFRGRPRMRTGRDRAENNSVRSGNAIGTETEIAIGIGSEVKSANGSRLRTLRVRNRESQNRDGGIRRAAGKGASRGARRRRRRS